MISPELQGQINEFANRLTSSTTSYGQDNNETPRLEGSLAVAMATVAILKRIVSQATWCSANDLMQILRAEGRLMVARAGIHDMIVGNMIRRVLKYVREDYHSASLHPLSTDPNNVVSGGASRDSELLHHATSKEDEKPTDTCLGHTASSGDGDPPDSLHSYMAVSGLRQTEGYNKLVPDLADRLYSSLSELEGELEEGAIEIRNQGIVR